MDEREKALLEIPPKTVMELVEELVRIRHKSREEREVKVPLATFQLRSGHAVTGWVLALSTDSPRGRALTVHVPGAAFFGGSRSIDYDVVYLDPHSIDTVTVHDAPRAAYLLTGGKVAAPEPVDAGPAPSRLQLKRKLEALKPDVEGRLGAPVVVDISWEGMPETAETNRSLDRTLDDLMSVLQALAADELGKEALAREIRKIWIGEGQTPGVSRAGDTLVVTVNTKAGATGRLPASQLRAAVEKTL